jgi:hypothetical protein
MKILNLVVLAIPLALGLVACNSADTSPAAPDEITLARNGVSDYRIVISSSAPELEKHAAEELQVFLREISGARLPIITDDQPQTKYEIILGGNRHRPKFSTPELGKEGFAILTLGDNLIIEGGSPRGTLYGVYTFLEDYLGCRWFSSKVSHIPQMPTITLDPINDVQVPVLDFREVYYADPMDPDFAARLKLNGNASKMKDHKLVSERHSGWGTWCHTFFTFVTPDKYFKDHPEYFSLTGGQRKASQLCLTNPDVFDITVARIKELTEHPRDFAAGAPVANLSRPPGPIWADKEDLYWDVSQMDWAGYCQCPNCKAIDQREGTPMGSILTFINKIAAQFPDRTISTLSYQYSRKPPKTLRPASNVAIMLCNIECTRGVAIPDSPFPQDIAFRQDIENWSPISNNLFVWDYVVNFGNLLTPNPNLRIQQPNIKLFVEHNAKGIFCQGSREVGGEFCELRNYLLAKLLWNPDSNVDIIIDDFLKGYYGPAAKPIRQYIDLLHDSAEKAGKPIGMNDKPNNHRDGFLSPELIVQYEKLFDRAEKLVPDNADLLFRVRTARMPLMYAQLEMKLDTPARRLQILDEFIDLARRNHLQRLSEWGNTPNQFRAKHLKEINGQLGAHLEPAGGYYCDFENVTVKLTCPVPDAQLRYTLDGKEPTATSTLYSGPISLTGPATVKALAFRNGQSLGTTTSALFRQITLPFESEIFRVPDEAAPLKLSVKNVNTLKLIVTDAGNGIGNDHGDWADAQLIDKNGKATWLTDLPIVSEKQGWGQLGIDKSINGNPLRIGSRSFARGLGAHAHSEITYNLNGKYEYFQAFIGVDAEANSAQASIKFKVIGQ